MSPMTLISTTNSGVFKKKYWLVPLSIWDHLGFPTFPICLLRNHMRPLLPGVLLCFGDMKPLIRNTAVAALDSWLAVLSLPVLAEGELFSDALKHESPILRAELYGWLAAKLHPKPEEGQPSPRPMKMPAEFRECVPPLLLCLEDRNGDVRKKAQEALLPFMIVLGFEPIAKVSVRLQSENLQVFKVKRGRSY